MPPASYCADVSPQLHRYACRCCVEANEQLAQLHALVGKLPPPPPPPAAQGAAAEGGEGQEGEEGPPALLAAPLGGGLAPEEQRRARLHAEVVHRGQALQLFESLQVCVLRKAQYWGGLRVGCGQTHYRCVAPVHCYIPKGCRCPVACWAHMPCVRNGTACFCPGLNVSVRRTRSAPCWAHMPRFHALHA